MFTLSRAGIASVSSALPGGPGARIGPLLPNSLARNDRAARWRSGPFIVRGVGDVFIAMLTPLPLALAIRFVYGLSTSTGTVVFPATVHGTVSDRVRGRVFTRLDVVGNARRPSSLATGAVLAVLFDAIGIRQCSGSGCPPDTQWDGRTGILRPL